MSVFRWNQEAQRIRKMSHAIEDMRRRLWQSDSDNLGWDHAFAQLADSLELTAQQVELQIDQRPKRVASR